MNDHLIAIGMFVFRTDGPTFDELERRVDFKWEASPRYGERDALQFTGPGEDKITISGKLVPEIAGSYSDIETLREMGDIGEVQDVVLGTGKVLGQYVIKAVDDRQESIVAGGMARVVDFAVDLLRHAD